ncbi:MAG: Hsp20/alpha crystallin family protein [Syntrophobacteraceae bacterium]
MTGSGDKDFLDELKAMKERMEDLFMSSFEPGTGGKGKRSEPGDWVPMSDIVDSGKELIYSIDLPGVMEHDIQVECKADRLWVSGLRKIDLPKGEAFRVERPRGAFSRVFKFPCPVDEGGIQAEFKKGVLTISVPKSSPECRTHRIEVRDVE